MKSAWLTVIGHASRQIARPRLPRIAVLTGKLLFVGGPLIGISAIIAEASDFCESLTPSGFRYPSTMV